MADREKVIRGLERHLKYETNTESGAICDECPYHEENDLGACYLQIFKDTLELLKEQEPVIPKEERLNDVDSIYRCGNCGTHFYYRQQKYCAICGREAKWNATD